MPQCGVSQWCLRLGMVGPAESDTPGPLMVGAVGIVTTAAADEGDADVFGSAV
jgi:hypothetical protein